MCKVYTGYCGTREIEHGLCAGTVDNTLAKARGLSLRTGAQTMLYLSLKVLSYTKEYFETFPFLFYVSPCYLKVVAFKINYLGPKTLLEISVV